MSGAKACSTPAVPLSVADLGAGEVGEADAVGAAAGKARAGAAARTADRI